jgi:transcriptional regulator with GAF, ATPase, and Fis domain
MEADHIIKVLKYTGWDKNEAAKILGISPQVLGDKIRKYKIMDNDSTNSQSV